MPYVKANVSEQTHRAIKMEAAKYDMKVDEVVAQILEENTEDVSL